MDIDLENAIRRGDEHFDQLEREREENGIKDDIIYKLRVIIEILEHEELECRQDQDCDHCQIELLKKEIEELENA